MPVPPPPADVFWTLVAVFGALAVIAVVFVLVKYAVSQFSPQRTASESASSEQLMRELIREIRELRREIEELRRQLSE